MQPLCDPTWNSLLAFIRTGRKLPLTDVYIVEAPLSLPRVRIHGHTADTYDISRLLPSWIIAVYSSRVKITVRLLLSCATCIASPCTFNGKRLACLYSSDRVRWTLTWKTSCRTIVGRLRTISRLARLLIDCNRNLVLRFWKVAYSWSAKTGIYVSVRFL